MNLDKFLASTQSELITWATGLSVLYRSKELDLTNPENISDEELLFVVAIYKGLADDGLSLNAEGFGNFMLAVEGELMRRNANDEA